ncbi:MAG: hypothetical protein M1835_007930 [Candelina submexicana]|nr:MAG: hypothetical protein M1835_007930 [Candelina submexicana]
MNINSSVKVKVKIRTAFPITKLGAMNRDQAAASTPYNPEYTLPPAYQPPFGSSKVAIKQHKTYEITPPPERGGISSSNARTWVPPGG